MQVAVASHISPVLRGGSDTGRDGRISTSSPITSTGIMHGSPLSDDSSHHSDSGAMTKETGSNGVINYSRARPLDNALCSQFIIALCNMAKDPSPRVGNLGRRALSIIGIELVVTKTARFGAGVLNHGEPSATFRPSNLSGLARSSSWFDLNAGNFIPLLFMTIICSEFVLNHQLEQLNYSFSIVKSLFFQFILFFIKLLTEAGQLSVTFRTPPVSPPRQNYLAGMRRVCSLEFRPHQLNSTDAGLADPLLGAAGSSGSSERSLLPQSTIYNWSCGHFSRPLLAGADDNEETVYRREEREKIALDRISKCQHSCEKPDSYSIFYF